MSKIHSLKRKLITADARFFLGQRKKKNYPSAAMWFGQHVEVF
jgi:hypothetical protein